MLKNWIKQKKNQTSVFLICGIILVLNHFVTPIIQKRAYFQNKVERLQERYETIASQQSHLRFHLGQQFDNQNKIDNLALNMTRWETIPAVQRQLSQIQEGKNLNLIRQQNEERLISDGLKAITINQTLEGRYEALILYLTDLNDKSNPVIIHRCHFENLLPLDLSPLIQATFEFTIYLTQI